MKSQKESDLIRWRKSSKNYRESHKEKGLCVNCSRPTVKWNFCEIHLLKNIEHDKDKKKRRKENNKCIGCGKPLIEEEMGGHIACFNCRQQLYPIKINEAITY